MAGTIVLRRSPGNRAHEELAGDLERQLRSRLNGAVPLAVRTSQTPPSGTVRLFEIGSGDDSTEDLSMTPGGTYVVPHGLGAPASGRLIVVQTAAAHLIDVDPSTVDANLNVSQYVAFQTSAACTYRILVFP